MSPIIITIQREITLSRIVFLLVASPYKLTSLFIIIHMYFQDWSEPENSFNQIVLS